MSDQLPTILGLDFDGVICDGMLEYFQSSKRAYQKIWNQDTNQNLEELAQSFYKLRPVIEIGWEMPILIRALVLGITETDILQNWTNVAQNIISLEKLNPKEITETLDQVRDDWIHNDLEGWLHLHQFYPGVIDKIGQVLKSSTKLYIITTKEGRFVKQLLQQQGLDLSESSIFGKEVKRPKYETLRHVLDINSETPNHVWFVEDLLKPLKLVQQASDLQGVKLFLADWGYNTPQIRESIQNDATIKLLSLKQFTQEFSHWP
ncbi:conserved hypothetical protein [Gloeothece citriformis PCC 7424]|uniref:Haloacid dehalogenase domain protein hydrolase n=1 Tax=Gloeothece citriformis (strain PCC 7424) TaxID=65393 RepID=B7KKK5_GLOC7|nr:HAD hydrolase-like protein [Gloeothece citriformis]ACK72338.1 conserved hypothetical protein [Gloeothece citriformis PCC 7424]